MSAAYTPFRLNDRHGARYIRPSGMAVYRGGAQKARELVYRAFGSYWTRCQETRQVPERDWAHDGGVTWRRPWIWTS